MENEPGQTGPIGEAEYYPYLEDPGLIAAAQEEGQGSRDLAMRMTTARMARKIAANHPDDPTASNLADLAEAELGNFVERYGLPRSLRAKSPES